MFSRGSQGLLRCLQTWVEKGHVKAAVWECQQGSIADVERSREKVSGAMSRYPAHVPASCAGSRC
jgi:hypothetical protein